MPPQFARPGRGCFLATRMAPDALASADCAADRLIYVIDGGS